MATGRLSILLITVVFCLNVQARTKLSTQPGTVSFGGAVLLPILIPSGGGANIALNASPQIGYFLTRQLLTQFNVEYLHPSITGNQKTNWSFGAALSAQYLFELNGGIYPFVGAGLGLRHHPNGSVTAFLVQIPLGILVPMNSHVALEFGMPLTFTLAKGNYQHMEIQAGFLGLKAFF